MSAVFILAADKPLPSFERGRERVICLDGVTATLPGFAVEEDVYYRDSVEALGFDMKPFRYELDLLARADDLEGLTEYIRANFSPGEELELWSVWVGEGGGRSPKYRFCDAGELDMDCLELLCGGQREDDITGEFPGGLISQICLTVTV